MAARKGVKGAFGCEGSQHFLIFFSSFLESKFEAFFFWVGDLSTEWTSVLLNWLELRESGTGI